MLPPSKQGGGTPATLNRQYIPPVVKPQWATDAQMASAKKYGMQPYPGQGRELLMDTAGNVFSWAGAGGDGKPIFNFVQKADPYVLASMKSVASGAHQ